MKIPSISLATSKSLTGIKNKFNHYCAKADNLMDKKVNVTGLLPNSLKKSPTTGLTTNQLVALILKNL